MSKYVHASYGTSYVDSGKKLTFGTQRLWYILSPALVGVKFEEDVEEVLNECKEWANKTRTGHLEKDMLCNSYVLPKIPELKGRHLIFMEGESCDNTLEGPPSKFWDDFMSRGSKTSDNLISLNHELAIESKWDKRAIEFLENVVYFQVSPYLYAFYQIKFEEDKPVLRFVFEEEMNRVTEEMIKQGKHGFGTLEKRLNDNSPMFGNFSYSNLMYLPMAKERLKFDISLVEKILMFLPEEIQEKVEGFDLRKLRIDEQKPEQIRSYQDETRDLTKIVQPYKDDAIVQSTLVNRKINAAAIENAILKQLKPESVLIFSKKVDTWAAPKNKRAFCIT